MRVTGVRAVEFTGTMEKPARDEFYEDWHAHPIDVYDEHRSDDAPAAYVHSRAGRSLPHVAEDDSLQVQQVFIFIETAAGLRGVAGPVGRTVATIALELADLIVGNDPLAREARWDQLYRRSAHGRSGKSMHAISALDCGLWDLAGRHYDEPVYRLLGGPTRTELPAYVSMLGYATEPERVRDRVREFQDRGYRAQKWFFPYGPWAGPEGKAANVAMAEAAREAAGGDYDLMFDAWTSWDRTYALEMVDRLAPVDPRWLEEPVMADRADQLAIIADAAPFPVAAGEHGYTRWGCHDLLDRGAVDILQPDTYWAGGLTELRKIAALASVDDVPVIPHGHSVPANIHLTAAQPPPASPLVEYLDTLNVGLQFFFDDPVTPVNGTIDVPDDPGFGVSIDRSKVDETTGLDFDDDTI